MPRPLTETYPDWVDLTNHEMESIKRNSISVNTRKFLNYHLLQEKNGHLFDYFLKIRCFNISQRLQNDFDHFIVISGKEGSGKSTLGIQMGSWIDPNFNESKICYTLDQIIQAVKRGVAGDCILIDEGAINLYSREAMSSVNRTLTKLFMIMRQKNLCLIIAIPNFHLLDSYIRDHRTDTLIQVTKRGSYKAITGNGIKRVSKIGNKFKLIAEVRCANGTFWNGHFNKAFPKSVDQEKYTAEKQAHMKEFIKELEGIDKDRSDYVRATKASKVSGLSTGSIARNIQEGKIKGKKILGRWHIERKEYDNLVNLYKNRDFEGSEG